MARGGNKRRKRQNVVHLVIERPTPEREAKSQFLSAGMAYRATPVIDTLLALKVLTHAEWASLDHYRDQAHKAQDDEAQSSTLAPERIMGGSRSTVISGPLPSKFHWTPAIAETARIESNLGELVNIARAIAVDDLSLTDWCVKQHGGKERIRGNKTEIVPRGTAHGAKRIERAQMELRWAAWRIGS